MTAEDVVDAYLTCALWSSCGDDDEPLDANYEVADVADETRSSALVDCEQFIILADGDLAGIDAEQVGHDFWLTRNRHGAGFWDRGLGERGIRLADLARSFGERWPYVGDDGRVHIA